MKKVKVQRYVSGRRPRYAAEGSDGKGPDFVFIEERDFHLVPNNSFNNERDSHRLIPTSHPLSFQQIPKVQTMTSSSNVRSHRRLATLHEEIDFRKRKNAPTPMKTRLAVIGILTRTTAKDVAKARAMRTRGHEDVVPAATKTARRPMQTWKIRTILDYVDFDDGRSSNLKSSTRRGPAMKTAKTELAEDGTEVLHRLQTRLRTGTTSTTKNESGSDFK